MRFGKKGKITENKKTRSCVVRLEKVSTPLTSSRRITLAKNSPLSSPSIEATSKNLTAMGPKKRLQTPQQKQTGNSGNTPAIRSNQKLKTISKSNRTASSSQATPARDDTPTPTIAAGRSRRAIKPNPKYASEDIVTPKMVRNVAKQRKDSTSDDFYNNNSDDDYEDTRKKTFSKHNNADKAYKVDEKDEAIGLDSDISDIEDELRVQSPKIRGRQRKADDNATPTVTKRTFQTVNSNVKRGSSSTTTLPVRTVPTQLQQLRRSLAASAQRNQSLLSGSSGGAHKRKLEESLDSDESDTSYSLARKKIMVSNLAGSKVRVPIRENSIISSSTPLNKNRMLGVQKVGSSSISSNQSLNGKPLSSSQIMERRRLIEATKSTISLPSKTIIRTSLTDNKLHQATPGRNSKSQSPAIKPANSTLSASNTSYKSIVGNSDANKARMRTSSPKPSVPSNSKNSLISQPGPSSSFSTQQQKKLPTLPVKTYDKQKVASTSNTTNASTSSNYQALKSMSMKGKSLQQQQNANSIKKLTTPENNAKQSTVLNDDSPNSTMDDFETMPTFTIVNVNDIINKKGDVLITKSKSPKSTVIEFSESISLDEDDGEENNSGKDKRKKVNATPTVASNKITSVNNRVNNSRSKSLAGPRNNNEPMKKASATESSTLEAKPPQILNHKLGLRNNQRITAKTTASVTSPPVTEKPAPRILNSVVGKKTQPVKPMIANLVDSADESFQLSLDEDEDTEDEERNKVFGKKREKKLQSYSLDLDAEDTVSQNTEPDEPLKAPTKALTPKNNSSVSKSQTSLPRKRRNPNSVATPIVVGNKRRTMTPVAAKENSLAATNQQASDVKSSSPLQQAAKPSQEKVVISREGDKIIKKITCFETWYVINMPPEPKRQSIIRNQLDMPLITLANCARDITLPSDLWTCKVTLYELSALTLAKSTLFTYTGDLTEYNINEEDRAKYHPSCVMFRRSITNRQLSRMPYDRAVIFKNKTFSTNIEGKNVRLEGAPSVITSEKDIEILLEVVDELTLESEFVENFALQQQ